MNVRFAANFQFKFTTDECKRCINGVEAAVSERT